MKRCSQCEKEKPETDFYKSAAANNGYQSMCKACVKISNKAYYLAHKKKDNARSKVYRLAHPEKMKALYKAYKIAHKEEITGRRKVYYLANRKKIIEKNRTYRLAGGDSDKKYRLAHKKKIADNQRAYRREHPEKGRRHDRKRRALKQGNKHEPYTGNYVFKRDGWICQLCGRKINKRLKYPNPLSPSIDHIVPLSKGGDDSPANVQATHLRCNVGKHATNKGQLRLFG